MKKVFLITGFFATLILVAIFSELEQQPEERCDFDGSLVYEMYRVEVTTSGGEKKIFASVCNAGRWLDKYPAEEDMIAAGNGGNITVVDEISLMPMDATLAYWVESKSFSNGASGCRVHVFKESGDAARHLSRYQGREKIGYLGDLGKRLVWAKNFQTVDLKGEVIELSTYKGRVVFLRFWSSANPFSKGDLTALATTHNQWSQRGFQVLAINVEQSKEKISRHIKDLELPYPILLDEQGEIADHYRVAGFPTGFLIDKSGIISNQSIGEILPEMLEPLIHPLLQ